MFGALLGIGGSLLGGVLSRNSAKKAQDRQNEYNSPEEIRARAEAAGFNPLSFIGPGVGNQAAPVASGHMGAAVADASMLAADAINAQKREQGELAKLEQQNQQLQKQITQMTIRPKGAGIYGNGAAAPGVVTLDDPYNPVVVDTAAGSAYATDEKGAAASEEKYLPGTKPGIAFGLPLQRSRLFSDAAWWTDAYGEPAEYLVAIPSMAADIGFTVGTAVDEAIKDSQKMGQGPKMRVGGDRYQMHSNKYFEDKRYLQDYKSKQKARNPLRGLGF